MSQKTKRLLGSIAAFLAACLAYFHPIQDMSQDLGRHIKLGQIILQTHTVPNSNLFSYTYPHFTFINLDWLSEVIFFLLFHVFGLYGIVFLLIFLVALGMSLLFLFTSRRFGIFASFLSMVFILALFTSRTLIRPEAFSYFFTVLFLVILFKNREKPTRWLYLLPIIELLWVNIHINFPVGIGLIGIFWLDLLFQKLQQKHGWNKILRAREFISLSGVLLLSTFATCINPYGLEGALYPLTVFSNYGYAIEENQSVWFLLTHGFFFPEFWLLFVSVGLVGIFLLVQWRKAHPIDWLLYIVFAYGALAAHRNFGLCAIGFYILLVSQLSSSTNKLATWAETKFHNLSIKLVVCIVAVGLLLLFIRQIYGLGLLVVRGPQEATDFFLANNLRGPIFNNFDIGSYLDYRLYPSEQVFVDGRPEAYPASFFQNVYEPMQEDPTIFAAEGARYHFQVIFFSHTDQTPWAKQFLASIVQNKQWSMVYVDQAVVIFLKRDRANQALIAHFGMDRKSVHANDQQQYSTRELFQLAAFFQNINWQEDEISVLQQLVNKDPHNCMVIQTLAQLFANQNNTSMAAIYGQQFRALCE